MSRVAKNPIQIVDGVTVNLEGSIVDVKGKIGAMKFDVPESVSLEINDNVDERYNIEKSTKVAAEYLIKAKEKLGWVPEHDLESLVKDMIQSDMKLMQKQLYLSKGGYN